MLGVLLRHSSSILGGQNTSRGKDFQETFEKYPSQDICEIFYLPLKKGERAKLEISEEQNFRVYRGKDLPISQRPANFIVSKIQKDHAWEGNCKKHMTHLKPEVDWHWNPGPGQLNSWLYWSDQPLNLFVWQKIGKFSLGKNNNDSFLYNICNSI